MDEIDFWTNDKEWLPDQQGHVFLGRAAHQIGRKLFAEKWSGKEPRLYAITASDPHAPHPKPFAFPQERSRFEIVQETVAGLCAAGLIMSAMWTSSSGVLKKIEARWWAASRSVIEDRFLACEINRERPFEIPDALHRNRVERCPIFLSQPDLEHYLAGDQFTPPAAIGRKPIDDTERLVEMRRLLTDKSARSVNDAAAQVAGREKGHSATATIKRLRDKYRKSATS